MTELIRKSFVSVETKVLDDAQGLVQNVFSVTGNVDKQDDVIQPGAFATASFQPTVVYSHAWDDINQVLGKVTDYQELMPGDPNLPMSLLAKGYGGVKSTVQFDLDTASGRLAFNFAKKGTLSQWSFAFTVAEGGSSYDEKGIRRISKIGDIFEVSLVLVGANPATVTMGAKSLSTLIERVETGYLEGDRWAALKALVDDIIAKDDTDPPATSPEPPAAPPEEVVTPPQVELDIDAIAAAVRAQLSSALHEAAASATTSQPSVNEPTSGPSNLLPRFARQTARPRLIA